jgi:hypothetical protein
MAGPIMTFAVRIDSRIEKLKKWAAFECWRGVTQMNPVRTGRSRAWWHIAIGHADLTPGPGPVTHGVLPIPAPPMIGYCPPGVPLIVSNNIWYIARLEHGSSKQAPNGFVGITVNRINAGLDAVVRQIRLEDEGRSV